MNEPQPFDYLKTYINRHGQKEKTMFHESKGLYFERQPNGDVRVIKTYDEREPRPDNVVLDHIIQAGPWASVIASMSKHGEIDGGFDRAVKFHSEP